MAKLSQSISLIFHLKIECDSVCKHNINCNTHRDGILCPLVLLWFMGGCQGHVLGKKQILMSMGNAKNKGWEFMKALAFEAG